MDVGAPDLPAVLAAFGARLHQSGVPVTPERSARLGRALALRPPDRLSQLYWLARVTLVSRPEQLATFDEVFAEVFRGVTGVPPRPSPVAPAPAERAHESGPPQPGAPREPGDGDGPPARLPRLEPRAVDGAPEAEHTAVAAASEQEQLSDKDFSECTSAELATIARLVDQLALAMPPRPSRRYRRDSRGRRPDLRATLRHAGRTGGDPVRIVRRLRRTNRRRLVIVADVSGSMESYSRVYLHLMRSAVLSVDAEAFVFATRLTRLTRLLAGGRTDAAYRAVSRATADWSGGTRIGSALTTFLTAHGRRGVARGAIVVIVSDGWDVGDPALLAQAMERLHRLAHRIVWVNPRSARPGFEPLVAGLRAALPYVDTMLSGHSLSALDEVVTAIARS